MTAHLLATVDASGQGVRGVFVWSAVLVALVFVAFIGYSYLRRWMTSSDTEEVRGFTLSDLRQMHREGKLSDAEFETMRAQMVGAAKRATDALPPVLPRPAARKTSRPADDDDDGHSNSIASP